jgi:hypothetical protein
MMSFTKRSPILITLWQAICHAAPLTEPKNNSQFQSCFILVLNLPEGADGSEKAHVNGPNHPGGK